MDRTSKTARTEALEDILDALGRLADTDAFATNAARVAVYDVTQGLTRLALQSGEAELATAVESFQRAHGI